MAIHRITSAANDFYLGSAGLSEDQLQAFLPVLSNDPRGATLYSISAGPPHALGGRTTNTPRLITILDDGITYTGFASIANGRVNLDFSQSSALIAALGNGDFLTGSFYYVDRLANGQFSSAKVTFTIRGISSNVANISGTTEAEVFEDGTLTAGGTLFANDADAGENRFQTPGSLAATFGTFTFNAVTGVWGYTLNNTAANVQGLISGERWVELITVTSLDGSDSEVISVTIEGEDDVATITGKSSDTVSEDGNLSVSGTLTVTDVDAGEASYQFILDLEGTYGNFSFTTLTGAWEYTLNNTAANVQALITGEEVEDTLVVNSLDGSATQTITVTIEGQDDPAQIGGVDTGEVTEDGLLSTSGALTIIDPDFEEEAFEVPADLTGDYGTFTLDTDGNWTYTIVDDDPAFDNLEDEQYFFDSLAVFSVDGTQHMINISILGNSNDLILIA